MNLQKIRDAAGGMTISEVARLTGVSRTTLHKIEEINRINGDGAGKVRHSKLVEILYRMMERREFRGAFVPIKEELRALKADLSIGNEPREEAQVLADVSQLAFDLMLLRSEWTARGANNGKAAIGLNGNLSAAETLSDFKALASDIDWFVKQLEPAQKKA